MEGFKQLGMKEFLSECIRKIFKGPIESLTKVWHGIYDIHVYDEMYHEDLERAYRKCFIDKLIR